VAVVTGASSGIGSALARGLGRDGVAVGLIARRADFLRELAEEIRGGGGVARYAAADVSDREALRGAIRELDERLGPVDLMIANAGIGFETPADGFDAIAFERILRVNVMGAAYAFEAVLPEMIARGEGHLVGVSSLAGYRGLPGTAGYCASKAALSTLLESLRVELRGRGIAVTTVHPGFVATAMTENAAHPRPFLMDADRAARIILRGIRARRREVNFPLSMAALMRLVRAMPGVIYDRAVGRAVPDRDHQVQHHHHESGEADRGATGTTSEVF
jgi:short-subunit dehydrogenase